MTLIARLRHVESPRKSECRVAFDPDWRKPVIYGLQSKHITIGTRYQEYRETPDQKEFWEPTDYWRSL